MLPDRGIGRGLGHRLNRAILGPLNVIVDLGLGPGLGPLNVIVDLGLGPGLGPLNISNDRGPLWTENLDTLEDQDLLAAVAKASLL